MLAGSVLLAAISIFVLPRSVAYDPWSWLIWGREITHIDLNTRYAATAVKPLPIYIDVVLSLAGSAAPVLWMLVARIAGLLAIALAFRLGNRLAGAGAGVIAAVGLAVSSSYVGYLLLRGMSEPMATATVLASVDAALLGRHRSAFAWLAVAALLRPEAWPFLICYAVWLVYRVRTPARLAALVVSVLIPPSWFVIDWVGARQFFRSAGAATHQSQGGPLLAHAPGLATVRETWALMSAPVVVLFVAGLAVALVGWRRTGRSRPAVWLGLGAIGWLLVDAILAQGRFATGAPRYLLPGVALACVVGAEFAVGCVRRLAARMAGSMDPAHGRLLAAALGVVVLGLAFTPRFIGTGHQVATGVREGQRSDRLATALQQAVTLAGGRATVLRCGPVTTQNFQVPPVAWQLRIPVGQVNVVPSGHGTVFQQNRSPRIPAALTGDYHYVGTTGSSNARWTILSSC
jgi:hypothetical protein